MSKKGKILYLILFFLGLIGFVYWDVLAIKEVVAYGTRVYEVILLGIVGLALCLFLDIILHELGHMVFGLIGQMKFKSIQFPFVKFTEVNGKIKVSFALSSQRSQYPYKSEKKAGGEKYSQSSQHRSSYIIPPLSNDSRHKRPCGRSCTVRISHKVRCGSPLGCHTVL